MRKTTLILLLATAFLAAQTRAAVNVNIYQPATDTGTSISFGNLIGTFTSPDIQFGNNVGWYWNPVPGKTDPNNYNDWGADFTGFLQVAAAGTYNIQLLSDDGSYLFVNGAMAINNGGDRSPSGPTVGVYLNAGNNPFELQFRENGWGTQGVDLNLGNGVTFGAVPEPTTLIAGIGALVLASLGLRSKRS